MEVFEHLPTFYFIRISWKPGLLAESVTKNMIGAAANSYMHGSYWFLVTKAKECRSRVSSRYWGRALRDDPNNGCERIKKWPIVVCPIRFHIFKQEPFILSCA